MEIITLICDLGNVLVHNHPEWAAKKFSKLNGLPLSKNMEIMSCHTDYMKGEITPTQFYNKIKKQMNLSLSA